jgi:glycosyltransferase involved in cell wall biosynthesis
MSIALLEAMASRLPVVATAVGGNPEVVVDGKTGFLVKRKSPGQMAEKILWLLTHRTEAATMGQAGRKRVQDYFDIRQTIKAYEAIYLNLAGKKRKRF